MAFKPSLILRNLPLTDYRIELCDGEEFRREDNENVPYDFLIRINNRIDNPSTSLQLSPGIINHFYPFNYLELNLVIIFSDSQKSPRKPTFNIENIIDGYSFLDAKAYKSTKFFQNYVDILRNEAPLFLNFSGEIIENKSDYSTLIKGNRSSKKHKFNIVASGGVMISTQREEVGEGEEK